ncbi:non-specific lipid transfer protein GPI-anchored 2 [Manihot esculenta]|uniref:Bifunctional inhibitor/plant lipid transfer protein/seed storage helical domain-containing protein n=1 Tax=Manihot esculenta TaxID=3983 RepID=A0A2C9V0G8_MANES|nr:non-specific lipid transfer protein GPI-anchored 2 [Manihot esculenta]OAY37573.1 hypothetical protein MANES_11G111900v8 [Manihot esculenta]
MLRIRTSTIVAVIFFSTVCLVSAQAPSRAPSSGMEPSPLSPSAPTPFMPLAPSAPTPFMPLGPSLGPSSLDCMTPLFNMSDCLTYVEESSNVTVPDKNCCPELAGLIDGSPICLCQLLSNTSLTESYGIKIDINRALKLPSVCRISTPPVSTCAALGYPVPGPGSGPTPSKGDIAPGVMSPSGLASSPSAGVNGASNIAGSSQAFIIGLAFSFLLTLF